MVRGLDTKLNLDLDGKENLQEASVEGQSETGNLKKNLNMVLRRGWSWYSPGHHPASKWVWLGLGQG